MTRRFIQTEKWGPRCLFLNITIMIIPLVGGLILFFSGCGAPTSDTSQASFAIAGHIYKGESGLEGVSVFLDGDIPRMTLSGEDGAFAFPSVPPGTYEIIPEKNGWGFTPAVLAVTMEGADSTGNDFYGSTSETAVHTWRKIYGGDDDDTARSVFQTKDKGYVIVGDTWSFGGDQSDIGVIKVNADGIEQWGKALGGGDEDVARDACRTRSGDMVIVGGSRSFGGPDMAIFVVRMDDKGNPLWMKTYGDMGDSIGVFVSETEDGGIVVAGETRIAGADTQICVLKLDGDGNEMWYYKDTREGGGTAREICFLDARQILVLGETAFANDQPGDMRLICLSEDGLLNWDETYPRYGHNTALSVVAAKDGTVLSAAKTTDESGMDTEVFILQTDASGAVLATISADLPDGVQVTDVMPLPDQGVVVAGSAYSDGTDASADIFMLKVNEKRRIDWYQIYTGQGGDQRHSVASCDDGGYILAGETVLPEKNDRDLQVLKVDAMGRIIDGPTILSTVLKSGQTGQFYRSQPLIVSGGSGNYQLEISGRHIGTFFSITSTGEVTGDLPETQGRMTLPITVTDLADPSFPVTKDFTIDVLPLRKGAVGGGSGYGDTVEQSAADIVVGETSSFLSALQSAKEGEVIYIENRAVLDMRGMEYIVIPGGVTIAGGRGMPNRQGGVEPGPLIYKESYTTNSPLFVTGGPGARITGLRIRGPGPYFEADYTVIDDVHYLNHDPSPSFEGSFGISTAHDLEIDNCELYHWSYAAVYVNTESTVRTYIHHNDIHDCKGSMGYGIEVYTGNPVITHNRFSGLKHAISGTGLFQCSYEAAYNEVVNGVTAYFAPGWGMSPISMQAFDMHHDIWTGDLAGDLILIYGNTFFWTKGPGVNVRGKPRQLACVFENNFYHDTIDSGVLQLNMAGNMVVFDNLVQEAATPQLDWQP